MLVDSVTITVRAGSGGDGAATFSRNKYTEKSAPNGGDGGKGGSIFFQGSSNLTDLREFRYQKKVIAADGTRGQRNNHFGRNAQDMTILVPLGTQITDVDSGESWELLDTKPVLIVSGGKGGKGNYSFRGPQNKLPDYAEKGEAGQARKVHLELRLIAEIGLIGLPNAGKSSLLTVLTNARPAIGAYPFTTLEPNIGMMDTYPIADIPGLIEGASKGKGLGTRFLKHIEKTKLLVHCIDLTNDDPEKSYETVRTEFAQYSDVLIQKPEIILLNKTDLVDAERIQAYKTLFRKKKKPIATCSIYDEPSIEKLKKTLIKSLKNSLSSRT